MKINQLLSFSYRQAQATVLDAIPRLKKEKIPTKRPDDYYAQMAKSDEHMKKVNAHISFD
jgi:rRNA-processing protein EBP2